MTTPIPELEPHCGSWICTSPRGNVVELFWRSNVELAAKSGWQIKTAAQHLGEMNELGKTPLKVTAK